MTIASLAQRARQSLARGLEALQTRDAPEGLLDVAEPVAYAISGLVDLELAPGPVNALSVEPVLDALRESLRLLQSPELAQHPAAARSMKAVAEALSIVVSLTRYIRGGLLIAGPFSMSTPTASVRASVPHEGVVSAAPELAPLRTNAPMESTLSMLGPAPVAINAMPPESALLGSGGVNGVRSSAPTEDAPAPAQSMAAPAFSVIAPTPSVVVPAHTVAAPASSVAAPAAAVAAPLPSVPASAPSVVAPASAVASMRPSIRSLSAPADESEPAVITRTVNAVNVAASPESTLRANVTTSLLSAAVPPGRVETAYARQEPSLVLCEPPRATPEPPPLLSPRPAQTGQTHAAAPSRAPVSIRRDVVLERDLRAVDAPLGAHSPSNFYTGLGGGDVVVSGGLFVATYQVPKIGEKVLLKISMPGGYEFVAKAKGVEIKRSELKAAVEALLG